MSNLNSRSMPQRTCLIVFQTHHATEPRRSTYAQLAQYNMRKSPSVYKVCHSIDPGQRSMTFRVAQATLAPLKLRLVKLIAGVSKLCNVWLSRLSSLAWISDMGLSGCPMRLRPLPREQLPYLRLVHMKRVVLGVIGYFIGQAGPDTVYCPCTT